MVHDDDGHIHAHDGHQHGQVHGHASELVGFIKGLVSPHSHDANDSVDGALEGSAEGIHAVLVALIVLLVTAGLQAVMVVASGSVALLGDTLHNGADALTAVPLFVAFRLGRRPATRRYTYGFGKSEDLAGLVVVVLIGASAILAAFTAVHRLLHPERVTHLGFVMAAAVIGAVGNEVVAQYRIRTGRRIGSAALEADGLHARTDGVTSLLVLVGAIGVALGAEWADPVVGLVIAAAIAVVGWQAARNITWRLLDAVDPTVIDRVQQVAAATPGVVRVSETRARWVGHRLFAQVRLGVDASLTVAQAHDIAEEAQHRLLHRVTNLSDAIIHVDPEGTGGDPHAATRHHADGLQPAP